MASTSQSHPTFPARPYSSTLHTSSKLPDRNAPLSFGASSNTLTVREAARQERERQERERSAQQAATTPAASNTMAQLTDEQRDEINEAFGLFDLDKDQLIDYHEFKVALKALGFDLSKPDLLSYLLQYGTPPPPSRSGGQQPQPQPQQQQQQQQQAAAGLQAPLPGQQQQQQQQVTTVPPSRLHLTLQAFQIIASGLIAARDPREEILRAFALFDTEGKGMITLEDLRRVARELNEGLEEEELVAMIEEFDLEGKGGVGQEEFVGICMG